jgi:hypothetical protein
MVASHDAEINLDAYARLAVALSRVAGVAGPRRGELLATHGLDEARWQAIDDAWQTRLSEALDAMGDEATVPPLVEAYSRAMERAQTADSQLMAFERFVQATRAARAGGDLGKNLERLGVTVDDYLRANRHYTLAMTGDDALAERFRKALE